MRKSLIFALFVAPMIVGCSLEQSASMGNEQKDFPLQTKAVCTGDDMAEYMLSETDLQRFVKAKELAKPNVTVSEIVPIMFNEIPCLYVVQYEDGFEIISADKRSPIPIATCDTGIFNECNDPEGFGGHIESIAEQVWFSLNGYYDNPSPETEEYIQSSLDFWKLVNADSTYIANNSVEIKEEGDNSQTRDPNPNPDPGHWELIDVINEDILYDSIPHLTTTTWYQDFIYNEYCPEDIDSLGIMIGPCPAGCVAIAGAQMLYFLHNKLGVPASSPGSGSCTGYVFDNSYEQLFWNYHANTWENMVAPRCPYPGSDTYAALLVGDVGKRLNMNYSYYGSGAHMSDLVNNVFSPYGINSTYHYGYNSNIIISSLLSGYPVVCSGSRDAKGVNHIGHCFLIDGYKRVITKTTYYYEWSTDDPTIIRVHPFVPRKTEVTYSSPYIKYYCMNWGQWNTAPNDVWCSIYGVWQYSDYPPYQYEHKMIYNFSANQ